MAKGQLRIKSDSPETSRKIQRGKVPPEKTFTFSFRYWKQIENFGLGDVRASWFVSLLDRLKGLSDEKVSRLFQDRNFRSVVRYHPVVWGQPGIPISKEDLQLPRDVADAEDLEIVQLAISRSIGRIHGFFDGNWCFNVVLLDPKHNLQPSKSHNYSVDFAPVLESDYGCLWAHIDALLGKQCKEDVCGIGRALSDALRGHSPHGQEALFLACLDQSTLNELNKLAKKGPVSLSRVMEAGILFHDEEPKDQ